MADKNRRQGEVWTVVVKPCGSPDEAEAVAHRVRQMVAGWLIRDQGQAAAPVEGR